MIVVVLDIVEIWLVVCFFLDSNECICDNGGCFIYVDCINLLGSYKCVCEEGFKGDGYSCGGEN